MDKVKRVVEFSFSSKLAFVLFLEIIFSIILSLAALFIFLKIGTGVLEKEVFSIDVFLANFIYSFRSPQVTTIMMYLTFFGSPLFLFSLSVIGTLYVFTKRRKDALIYFVVLYSGVMLNLILKYTFQRPRPHYLPLISEDSFSFPSGHAMNSFVFYAALSYFILRETKSATTTIFVSVISVVIILCIGLSRIYLGVHYPSDIIAGYITGFLWFTSAILFEKTIIFERLYKRMKNER
ncbi:MAG: phosphatase PAP2 family protein [Patescibacteria group bacterium]